MRIDLSQSCYEVPFSYPGRLLNHAWLLCDRQLSLLQPAGRDFSTWTVADRGKTLDDTLKDLGAASVAQRIPLLSFGANRSPENVAWKFRQKNIGGPILAIPVTIRNADVVVANIFYSGHFYVDLAWNQPWTEGVDVEAVLLLVSTEQAYAIHKTEEVPEETHREDDETMIGARLAKFDNVYSTLTEDRIDCLGYVSWSSRWADENSGLPIALTSVRAANRRVGQATQVELFDVMRSRYCPETESTRLKQRFQRHWKAVRSGTSDGYGATWYMSVVQNIKRDCYRDGQGRISTGISDAQREDRLISIHDSWALPRQYYYGGAQ